MHSNHSGRLTNDAEEVGIKLAHARLQAMSYQCELQAFIDFDKLIDISVAYKLWSAALCKTRVSFMASKTVMHMNCQSHCRACDERNLCPCKRCFTSVPPAHTPSIGIHCAPTHGQSASAASCGPKHTNHIQIIVILLLIFY